MTTITDEFRSDFNHDGFGDILWRDAAGDNVLWVMSSTLVNHTPSTVVTLPSVTLDWHVKADGNFDKDVGNAAADILWQNDNGSLAFWAVALSGGAFIRMPDNPGPTWHVVGDNDFNGDGADDIFFQNNNGAVAMWAVNGLVSGTPPDIFAATQNPGPTWHVVGTGDTDDDGKAGILWQNNNGALALWEKPTFGAGTFTFNTLAALPTVDPSWHVKGMADLNGDMHADIIFQNNNGAVAVWEMGGADGTTINAVNLINLNPGPTWHIVGLRDMNNVATFDILFQNDNGAAAIWEFYQSLGSGSATFQNVLAIDPNPNPNGHVWDLL